MEITKFGTRHNIMNITSIHGFAGIRGGMTGQCRDVYFVRTAGVNPTFLKDVEAMDEMLAKRELKGQGRYIRFDGLPRLADPNEIGTFSGIYEQWEAQNHREAALPFLAGEPEACGVFGSALEKADTLFAQNTPNASASIRRNFLVKVLYWTAWVYRQMGDQWSCGGIRKAVYFGKLKKQEYLFFYSLTLTGVDVLLLSPQGEIQVEAELLALSECIRFGQTGALSLPPYDPSKYKKKTVNTVKQKQENPVPNTGAQSQAVPGTGAQSQDVPVTGAENQAGRCRVVIKHPERERRRNQTSAGHLPVQTAAQAGLVRQQTEHAVEMEFEELAKLASSVVMITIHDRRGKVIGTGSGIMISHQGYILTNNHVACGGSHYSVRIEEEEKIYQTDEMIKYNQVLDLALIRIDRSCCPIPIYRGEKNLVRGQKVVAIGSPLGLFNSVSDGIISGFRNIDNVDMIQFTAPISHGSSGGAVLNMYGEVIGISTAGIDSGQNINLAVGYQYIKDFVRGFI